MCEILSRAMTGIMHKILFKILPKTLREICLEVLMVIQVYTVKIQKMQQKISNRRSSIEERIARLHVGENNAIKKEIDDVIPKSMDESTAKLKNIRKVMTDK